MATPIGDLVAKLKLDTSNFEKGIDKAKSEAAGLDSKMEHASKSMGSSLGIATKAATAFGAALAFGQVATFGKEVFDTGRRIAATKVAFTEITGSATLMAEEMNFVRKTANDMGQNFYSLTDSYKGLLAASRGTALEGQRVRDVFTAVTKASTSLGLSTDETKGALIAIQQMMSKGKVSAEELRQQLGERLPGAFNLMAEAVGVSTAQLDKMLQQGEVIAADVLPKFAAVLEKKYSGAVSSSTAAVNKLTEAWEDFKVSLSESGFQEVAVKGLNALTKAVKALTEGSKLSTYRDIFEKGKELARDGQLDWQKFVESNREQRLEMIRIAELQEKPQQETRYVKGFTRDFSMMPWNPSEKFRAQQANPFGSQEEHLDWLEKQTKARLAAEEKVAEKARKEAEKTAKALRDRQLDAADFSLLGKMDVDEQDKWISSWNKEVADFEKQWVQSNEQIGQVFVAQLDARDQATEKSLALRKSLERDYYNTLKQGSTEWVAFSVRMLDQEYEEKKKMIDLTLQDEQQKTEALIMLDQWRANEQRSISEKTSSILIDLSEQAARAMEQNFSNFFFDLFNGKMRSMADFSTAIFQSLTRMAADYIGQLARIGLFGDKNQGVTGLLSTLGTSLVGAYNNFKYTPMSQTTALALVKHGGGKVDGTGPYRQVPASLFDSAPRLHDGLKAGEYPAVLEQGEGVIPKDGYGAQAPIIMNLYYQPNNNLIDSRGIKEAILQEADTVKGIIQSGFREMGKTVVLG